MLTKFSISAVDDPGRILLAGWWLGESEPKAAEEEDATAVAAEALALMTASADAAVVAYRFTAGPPCCCRCVCVCACVYYARMYVCIDDVFSYASHVPARVAGMKARRSRLRRP